MIFRNSKAAKLKALPVLLGLVFSIALFSELLFCQERLKASFDAAQKLFERGQDDQAAAAFGALVVESNRERAALSKKERGELSEQERKLLVIYTQVLAGGHNFLGLIAARHERFTEAARQFAEVRTLRRGFPDVDFNLGLAWFGAERYSEAAGPLEKALLRDPTSAKAKKYLGMTLAETGQYEKAVKLLREVRAQQSDAPRAGDPGADDPRVLLALGTALARSNRPDESRQVFEELLKSQPDSAESHVLWGQVFAAQSQAREAEGEFRRGLELDSKVSLAHFFLGMLSLRTERLEEAQHEFAAELVNHPEDTRARYHLAFVLLALQKPGEAVPMLRQVLAEQPDYAEAHYSLGKALLQQEKIKEAIEHLESATRLDSGKTYSHYQLARAYQRAGRTDEAQKEFKITHDLESKHKARPSHEPEIVP